MQRLEVRTRVAPEWSAWMRDFEDLAGRLLNEAALEPKSDDEAELISVKSALYARALTVFSTLIVLADLDKQLDLRIHSRALVEAALFLPALDADPSLILAMKEDDLRSRRERAKLHRKAAHPASEAARLLDGFIAEDPGRLRHVRLGELAGTHDLSALYAAYRDISADSAHATFTSLLLHVHDDAEDGMTLVVVDPALDEVVLEKTLLDAAFSIIVATCMLMKCRQATDGWDGLEEMVRRYRALPRRDRFRQDGS